MEHLLVWNVTDLWPIEEHEQVFLTKLLVPRKEFMLQWAMEKCSMEALYLLVKGSGLFQTRKPANKSCGSQHKDKKRLIMQHFSMRQ